MAAVSSFCSHFSLQLTAVAILFLLSSFGETMPTKTRPLALQNHARFSIRRSLGSARNFSALLHDRLQQISSSDAETLVRALQDCLLLASLNADYIAAAIRSLNSSYLDAGAEEDALTLLSAVVTNDQTCLESLWESSAADAEPFLLAALFDDAKLHRLSLALFSPARRGGSSQKILQRSNPATADGFVMVREAVFVRKDGSGNFTTITDAVAAAPNNTDAKDGYFVIYVAAGVYDGEYVFIGRNKKNIMMIGDGINRTIVTGDRSVDDGWTTFNSATFAVVGEGFVAVDITFRNTAGAEKHQAVALRSGADFSAFHRCSFEGYQDTLYAHSLRQLYRDCAIYGTVDFVFGNAAVVLQNCTLYARLPLSGQTNTITAQGRTDPNQNTGTSVQGCAIRAASDLASSSSGTKSYLGRPWKNYSRTVFMESYMEELIEPAGWLEWSGSDESTLSKLYYGEYSNSGPGSDTSRRVLWPGYHPNMSTSDAGTFTASSFVSGDEWIASTGVPYQPGL